MLLYTTGRYLFGWLLLAFVAKRQPIERKREKWKGPPRIKVAEEEEEQNGGKKDDKGMHLFLWITSTLSSPSISRPKRSIQKGDSFSFLKKNGAD